MKRIMVTAAVLLGLQCVLGHAYLSDKSEVKWDAENFVVFEDVGREPKTGPADGIAYGTHIVLHVKRDGRDSELDLQEIMFPLHPLSSMVRQVRYSGKDRVWIVSRLGKRLDGAVLLDLASGDIVSEHFGTAFSVSPDGSRIAFAFPMSMNTVRSAIFVDDTMVFPEFLSGFTVADSSGPRRQDGTRCWKAMSAEGYGWRVSELQAPPRWVSDNEVRFVLRGSRDKTINKANRSDKASAPIQVMR